MRETLPEYGCEIDGSYYWGTWDSDFLIQNITYDPGDIRTNDVPSPREDGQRFGRDYLSGQLISIEMTGKHNPHTEGAAQLDAYGRFRGIWRDPRFRGQAGMSTVLRMGRAGRVRRVYGRPRQALPTLGKESEGHTFVTATFQCWDDLFYSDTERQLALTLTPSHVGGFSFPAIFPWRTGGQAYEPGVFTVGGDAPAWMCFKIYGPILRPVIRVRAADGTAWAIGLQVTLQAGEWIAIDPRPWSRGVRSYTGAWLGGALLPGSPLLSSVKLAPGSYELSLIGTDETGTARLETAWRETYAGP